VSFGVVFIWNFFHSFLYREVVSEEHKTLTKIHERTLEMLRNTVQVTKFLPILLGKRGISMSLLYCEDGKTI
jgi:hypothetical protein